MGRIQLAGVFFISCYIISQPDVLLLLEEVKMAVLLKLIINLH